MKKGIKINLLALLLVALVIGNFTPAYAATTPSLGLANSFGILSSTYTNTTPGTTINGDLGYTTGPATTPTVNGTTHVANGTYNQAGTDQGSALTALNSQACTFSFAGGAIDLATDTTHGPIGVYTPGVYCVTGAASIGTAGITLNGAGTYIFRSTGALTSVVNSVVTLSGGASACNVFWTPGAATVLGANSTFVGNNIDALGITLGNLVVWSGRALAFGGTVTTASNTINVPTCSLPISSPTSGGLPLNVSVVPPIISITKVPNPLSLPSGPGPVTYNYTVTNIGTVPISNVKVVDDKCSAVSFVSGDNNGDNNLDVNEVWTYRCNINLSVTTTNVVTATGQANGFTSTHVAQATVVVGSPVVPPLIHVTKIPFPLSLPIGGGLVTYSYVVTNPGVVPLSNVAITDDKCSSVLGGSGDTNNNNLLDVNEAWAYRCVMNITSTTVNTVTAQGSANGFTVRDSAVVTVVVAPPILPKTGIGESNSITNTNTAVFAIFSGILLSVYLIKRKQTV